MKKNEIQLYINRKPISNRVLEKVRKDTAKHLFILNKQDGTCRCEKCECTSTIEEHTRHLGIAECPVCHAKMKAIHTWRRSYTEDIAWNVAGECIDADRFMLRYILCFRINGSLKILGERARMVLDFGTKKEHCFENPYGDEFLPREHRASYFREYQMCYQPNRLCCLDATPLPSVFSQAQKLDVFKYWSFKKAYKNCFYVSGCIGWLGRRADLYEKMQKVGLNGIIQEDLKTYWSAEIKYNKTKTELNKMLGITKAQLNLLRKYPSLETLKTFQSGLALDENTLQLLSKYRIGRNDIENLTIAKLLKTKVLKYIGKQKISVHEYIHYVDLLKKLEYKLDKAYMYPTDFYKMDKIVADEYAKQKNLLQDGLIKKLSDGLRQMPGLQELLNGSKGFLVYVPENQADLDRESAALHNCIRGYGDRLANQKTILFFIRRLNAPNEPFVAMEYCHGGIVQIRYAYNKDVMTSKKKGSAEIIELANCLASVLKENNVLVA